MKTEGVLSSEVCASRSLAIYRRIAAQARKLILETQPAYLGEESFVRHAELFRRSRLVPFRFAQRVLNLESLHVRDRSLRHLFERPFPQESFFEHAVRQFLRRGFCSGQLQRFRVDLRSVCENRGALDGILQFADVSGPWVRPQPRPSVRRQFQPRFAKLALESLQKMFCQQQYVVAAVAQRRNGDGHRRDTEIEILAEGLVLHGG